jgi:hypothetical protein
VVSFRFWPFYRRKEPPPSLNRQTTKTEHADKHTRKETTKLTKENRGKNTNGNMQCDHEKEMQKTSSDAESFKHVKIKYLTHLNMAM